MEYFLEVWFNLDDASSKELLSFEASDIRDIFCVLGQNMSWQTDSDIDYIVYHCGDCILSK